jgi:hypothetical protein
MTISFQLGVLAALHPKKQGPQVSVDVCRGEEMNYYSSRKRDPMLQRVAITGHFFV